MANALRRACQRAHGARAKTERIGLKIIVAKYLPSPTDHRIGVNVRTIRHIEFLDQLVAQVNDRLEIVETERIGGAECRDDGGDGPAALQRSARLVAQDVEL